MQERGWESALETMLWKHDSDERPLYKANVLQNILARESRVT